MKEEINLLPLPLQHRRLFHLYNRRLHGLTTHILIALGLVLLGQISSLFALQQTLAQVTHTISISDQQEEQVLHAVRSSNQVLSEVQKRLSDSFLWSQAAEDILKTVPPELFVTSFDGKSEGDKLTVTAVSSSRSAGVVFENALKGLPWVETLDAPLQNFALSDNSEFTFNVYRQKTNP